VFRHSIPIGRIFGISIDLDYSWFLIVGLLAWLLAVSYYPAEFPHWSAAEYWLVGTATAVMLFVSVLIHELGHSVVAKGFGLSVPRITLFIFGGVSQIATEPSTAAVEFWVAIVGPLTSFALAALFWGLAPHLVWSPPLFALAKYLAFINLILGVFNLIPGFPLDGGRVFRAIVWQMTGKYQRATSIAATTGRFFGFLLIFLGVWQVLGGNLINGLWIAFIGWFLESAAASQLQQELMKSLLGEHKVVDAMKREFLQVPADLPVQEIIDRHILTGGTRYLLVSANGGPAGMITIASIGRVPRSVWATTTASQVMVPLQKLATTRPNARLWSALEEMGRDGVNQLPVIDGGGKVVGIVSREDVLHYLRVLQTFAR
jgi:Zn-dependent protease/CBS domain-containing protein